MAVAAYEMFPGHTADKTTLREMLATIRRRHGAAERIWIMDRGIPTEEILMTTLRQQLRGHAVGLMPRVVFERLATIQILDVCVPRRPRVTLNPAH